MAEFSKRLSTDQKFTVPDGQAARIFAFSLDFNATTLIIGGDSVGVISSGDQSVGPVFASAGSEVATAEHAIGISVSLEPAN